MADATEETGELVLERAEELLDDGAELIDVRRPHEFEAGRIPGARHIELTELTSEAERLGRGSPIVVYCRSGDRSAMGTEALRDGGFDAHSLAGGIEAWQRSGRSLEPEEGFVAESGRAAAILQSEGRFPVEKTDPPAE